MGEALTTIRSGLKAGKLVPRVPREGRPAMSPVLPDSLGADAPIDDRAPHEFPITDAGNAELLAQLFSDQIKYDHIRRRWYLWAGHRWQSDGTLRIYQLAKEAARTRYHSAAAIEDEKARIAQAKFATYSETSKFIDAALKLAMSEPALADDGKGWDTDPYLLGVANGVVDLRTGVVRAGLPADRMTLSNGVEFVPDAQCPQWLRFLDEVFEGDAEVLAYLRRGVGYSLTGHVTEQVLHVCHGSGSNGKSVFLDILSALAGEYATNTAFSTFEARDRGAIPNDLAALAGKRLITSAETNENARLNEARVKAFVHGDTMTARFMRANFFDFRPAGKLWWAVNHKPKVMDDSKGFWRSVRLIPFLRTFEGDEQDRGLTAKLLEELPGILQWAIAGAVEWSEQGLDPPESVRNATQEYQDESDLLRDFIAEACVENTSAVTSAGDLYKAYKSWADSSGLTDRERLNSNAFGRRLGTRFKRKPTASARLYRGIGLKVPS